MKIGDKFHIFYPKFTKNLQKNRICMGPYLKCEIYALSVTITFMGSYYSP